MTAQNLPTKSPHIIQPNVHQRGRSILSFLLIIAILVGLVLFGFYVARQDKIITSKFEGKRWNLPAKVYSQPLELYQGAMVSQKELDNWLELLNYRKADDYKTIGTYQKQGNQYFIHTRAFSFSQQDNEPNQVLKVQINGNKINHIQSTQPNQTGKARLEPVLIGGIYPDNNEDRIVLNLTDMPQSLIDALIATEDRAFYDHKGISIRGTTRALVSNITGGKRQGGSTITQQLVKNFYLNSDRTLKRKANEAIMAILLEVHYSKNDILQTYMNEINLGQSGNHSINGFGLAAQFYFNRPLNELRVDQLAMLVGLAKGPSQYNPFMHPKQAKNRRDTVLHNMLVMGKISQKDYDEAIDKPLDVVKTAAVGKGRFPDFLDMVKRELNNHYDASDLKNEGLRIFTTLNPNAQLAANQAVHQSLNKLRKSNPTRLKDLQSALVSADPKTGELLATVGSSSEFTGFNRAVDAKRQVGSLLKPIIYLTALEQGKYNLASGISDEPIEIKTGGKPWRPNNYDGVSHGTVPLMTALANSYNITAVRTGMEVGIPKVINQLYAMGINQQISPYPATLLGAVDLSPMDMLNVYQVLANGGQKIKIHTIRSVVDNQGRVIQGTTTNPQQVIDPTATYLTNYAMQQIIKSGTAKSAQVLGENLKLSGKTGTTNDYKDAWFAGYSGNYVSVIWVGRDDNKPINLSGGSGALPIWINYMKRLQLTPVNLPKPDEIEWTWLENGTGKLATEICPLAVYLPVNNKHMPEETSDCTIEAQTEEDTETDETTDETNLDDNTADTNEQDTTEDTSSNKPRILSLLEQLFN